MVHLQRNATTDACHRAVDNVFAQPATVDRLLVGPQPRPYRQATPPAATLPRLLRLVTPVTPAGTRLQQNPVPGRDRSEEHTSELQSRGHLVCRLLLDKKKKTQIEAH